MNKIRSKLQLANELITYDRSYEYEYGSNMFVLKLREPQLSGSRSSILYGCSVPCLPRTTRIMHNAYYTIRVLGTTLSSLNPCVLSVIDSHRYLPPLKMPSTYNGSSFVN